MARPRKFEPLPDIQGPDAASHAGIEEDQDVVEARHWLNDMVRTDCSVKLLVTPAIAKACLERNTERNRRVRESHLRMLTRAHLAGTLMHTGDPIAFDRDGVMSNGRHRCEIIKILNKPLTIRIEFGLDPAAFMVTDSGRKRTTGDALRHEGHVNVNNLGAAINWARRIDLGVAGQAHYTPLGPDETLDLIRKYADLPRSINAVDTLCRRYKLSRGLLAGLHWHLVQIGGRARADAFFSTTAHGLGLTSDSDPHYVLSRRLSENLISRRRMHYAELLAIFIKAWNATVAGKRLHQLVWRSNTQTARERFPDIAVPKVAEAAE